MTDPDPLKLECLAGFDHGRFGVACRAMQVLLAYGYVDRAVDCLRQFAVQSRRQVATPQTPLVDVVPVRLANALEELGVTTLAAFLRCGDRQLEGVANVGSGAIRLREQLRSELLTGELRAGEEVDDLSFDFLTDEYPEEVLKFIERKTEVSATEVTVLDALKVIAERGSEAVEQIDVKIEQLQSEIDQLKKMRALLGPKETRTLKLTAEHLKVADRIESVLKANAAAMMPKHLAAKCGLHYAIVGRIARADRRFMRYDDGRIGLA